MTQIGPTYHHFYLSSTLSKLTTFVPFDRLLVAKMQGGRGLLPHEEQLIPGCVRYALELEALGGQQVAGGGGRMALGARPGGMGDVGAMGMERRDGLRMDAAHMDCMDRVVDGMMESSEMEMDHQSAGLMPPLNPPPPV